MKHIIISALLLLIVAASCSKAETKKNDDTAIRANSQIIDTILIQNDNIDKEFFTDARWTTEALRALRRNKTPYEVVMVENAYSEIQDSMLVFTGNDFKYAFLKVNHLDRLILEYFEENNLDTRTPIIKEVKEKIHTLAEEMEIDRADEYVLHAKTETEMSDLFLVFNDRKIVAAKFLGWVD